MAFPLPGAAGRSPTYGLIGCAHGHGLEAEGQAGVEAVDEDEAVRVDVLAGAGACAVGDLLGGKR